MGSLFLEQIFDIEVLSLGSDLLNTTLTISDNNNSLDPLVIKFSNTSGGDATTIKVDDSSDLSTIRNDIIEVIIDTMAPRNGAGEITSNNLDVTKGPVIDNNQTGSSKFRFSALSGALKTSNRSAILVVEHSNMLVMGSGYTTATPVINQVPNIFGFLRPNLTPLLSLLKGLAELLCCLKRIMSPMTFILSCKGRFK